MAVGCERPRGRYGPRASRPVMRAASRPHSRKGCHRSPRAGVPSGSAPLPSVAPPDSARHCRPLGALGPRARAAVSSGARQGRRHGARREGWARSASRRAPSRASSTIPHRAFIERCSLQNGVLQTCPGGRRLRRGPDGFPRSHMVPDGSTNRDRRTALGPTPEDRVGSNVQHAPRLRRGILAFPAVLG